MRNLVCSIRFVEHLSTSSCCCCWRLKQFAQQRLSLCQQKCELSIKRSMPSKSESFAANAIEDVDFAADTDDEDDDVVVDVDGNDKCSWSWFL